MVHLSTNQKIQFYILKYPLEFIRSRNNSLYCQLCRKNVSCERKSSINSHRDSKLHLEKLNLINPFTQPSLPETMEYLNTDIVKTFLEADIPLFKLRNKSIIKLFAKLKVNIPSETTARRKIFDIAKTKLKKINDIVKDNPVFLIIDETQINNCKYINILIGIINEPNKSYLINTIYTQQSVNSQFIVQTIDDTIKNFGIIRQIFVLLLTDAARYMTCGTSVLKTLYPNLTHCTCLLHLLHNSVLKIRAYYKRVDFLISSIKAATVKNQHRRSMFDGIGVPPQTILTRWGSWLIASQYYSVNYRKVKEIVMRFEGNGVLTNAAKNSINDPLVHDELVQITRFYKKLNDIIGSFEKKEFCLCEGYEVLTRSNFGDDPCKIKDYFYKRLAKNDISSVVIEDGDTLLSPYLKALVQQGQCTTIDVERSFSMLSKLLRDDRNFNEENIKYYMISYYNSNI